jgi:nicotinate-nucleotide pyrophosphorylase (carboxylating)
MRAWSPFRQRMSGIATTVAAFAEAIAGLPARILDTRKTAPGFERSTRPAAPAGGFHG